MKTYKPNQRMTDNTELLEEIKSLLGTIDEKRITNMLLSDVSVSLAMIAELLNLMVDIK